MAKKLTQAEFLAKAVAVHGVGRYDYSQVAYRTMLEKAVIICPEHGSFQQALKCHLAGRGCPKCGGSEQLNTASFIEKAAAKHGGIYDYSRAVYEKASSIISIGCPSHGPFSQVASAHLAGHGCPCCGKHKATLKRRMGLEEFIDRARLVHGAERYDYSRVIYKNNNCKVVIKCRAHGLFKQIPYTHISGGGCPFCAGRGGYATESFRAACSKHFPSLDFSRATCENGVMSKMLVGCPKHGDFKTLARDLLRLQHGCPACGQEAREAYQRLTWLEKAKGADASMYFVKICGPGESFYKVGITYRPIARRFTRASLPADYSYEVLAVYKSSNSAAVYDWEQSILETFAHLRYKPIHSFGGATECFSSCDEILSIFPVAG